MFNLIRTMAGMDLQETRRRQVGQFQVMGPHGHHLLTITTSGSSKGQLLRIDVDLSKQVRIPYDTLGLLEQQREILDPLQEEGSRHGIVLISTPPGQGLTTMGYALLTRHDSYTSNVRSLERGSRGGTGRYRSTGLGRIRPKCRLCTNAPVDAPP